MVFGVRSQFRCEAPAGRPWAWRIWALTPKTPAPEFRGIAAVRADPSIPQDRVRKRIEAFFLNQTGYVAMFRCRSIAAAGDSLSLASPRESKQREGDPGACVPSLRYGQPAVLASGGVTLELAALRQSRALIRLKLRSSAHSQGFGDGIGVGFRSSRDCVTLLFS